VDHHQSIRLNHQVTPPRADPLLSSIAVSASVAQPPTMTNYQASASPSAKPKPSDSPTYRNPSSLPIQRLSIDIPRIQSSHNDNHKKRSKTQSPSNIEPENTTSNHPESSGFDDTAASVVSSVSDSTEKGIDEDTIDDLFSQYEGEGIDDASNTKLNSSSSSNNQSTIPIVPMEWSPRAGITSGLSFPVLNSISQSKSSSNKQTMKLSSTDRYRRHPGQSTVMNNRPLGSDSSVAFPVEQDLAFLTPTSISSKRFENGLRDSHFSFSPEKMSKQQSLKQVSLSISSQAMLHPRKSPKSLQVQSAPQSLDAQVMTSSEAFPARKIKRAQFVHSASARPQVVSKSTSVPNLGLRVNRVMQRLDSDGSDYHYDRFEDLEDEHDDAEVLMNTTPSLLNEHKATVSKLKTCQNLLLSASHDGSIRIWAANECESRAVLDISAFSLSSSDKRNERKITLGSRRSYSSASDGDTTTSAAASSSSAAVKILNMWCENRCDTIWGACSDGNIRVWNGVEGKPMRFFTGHEDAIQIMEGIENANGLQSTLLVASGSSDKTVRIWDARAKRAQIFLFKGHSDIVTSVKWTEGGRAVVSAGKDKTIKIWDTRAGRLRSTIEKHFSAVSGLQAIPDYAPGSSPNTAIQPSFLSAGRDAMLYLWTGNGDCIGSQALHRGNIHFLSEVNANLLHRSSNPTSAIISLGADNCIKVWDLKKNRCLADVANHPGCGVFSKAVWIRSHHVITASNTGSIKLWSYPAANEAGKLRENASFASLAQDGALPLSPAGAIAGGVQEWQCQDLPSHAGAVTDLVATNQLVACSSKAGQILRWSI
jgi:WD40 repeat protein